MAVKAPYSLVTGFQFDVVRKPSPKDAMAVREPARTVNKIAAKIKPTKDASTVASRRKD